ncbi:MAG: DUF4389 domain-containing protein [Dehalococcoidia bacterium]
MATMTAGYPVTVDVDDAKEQNRLSVLLRIIFAIPALLVAAVIGLVAAVVAVIAWFAILITGKFPAGMLSFVVGALRWTTRVSAYCYLLTDKYPPFSGDEDTAYPIRLQAVEQVEGRNRLTTLFRVIMIIPHYIIVGVLGYAAGVVALIGWFAALFTGSVPTGLHSFLTGYTRWNARYMAYALLITDDYPPFSLT